MTSYTSRIVPRVIKPKAQRQWGGFIRVIDPAYEKFDPFIFLVHHQHSFAPGEITGFPPHPHRGFETVTYAIEGGFDHADSRGNHGRYENGDVQWMTAGSGVLHSEMFVVKKTKPCTFNGFQLWLNLPKRLKMSEPGYQMLWNKDIPVVCVKPNAAESASDNSWAEHAEVRVKIIAGRVNDVKASVERSTPLSFFHVKMEPKARWKFALPHEHNCLVYVMSGGGQFGPETESTPVVQHDYFFLTRGDLVQAHNDGDSVLEFLLLEGKPYGEPIAQQGPWVMNERHELMQAVRDFQAGMFGDLDKEYVGPLSDEPDHLPTF